MAGKSETDSIKKEDLLPLIAAALKEDVGGRDLTSSVLVPKDQWAKADLVVRAEGVVAGLQVAEWVFGQVDPKIRFKPNLKDGDRVHPGKVAAYIEGPARGILAAERTALNFFCRLSGIATLTRRFVDRVRKYKVQIMDTRKTTPTLRFLEKYAVAMGGGTLHRKGLFDQVLIKDNHLQLVASRLYSEAGASVSSLRDRHRLSAVELAVMEARRKLQQKVLIEVEVRNLQEVRLGLSAQADILLLDNMPLADIQEAVRLRNAVARSKKERKPLLEVSGGVKLENVESIAAAGVDRISIGALTHSALALDAAIDVVG
ncbi:MAG: nicotinate-nucleotide diphosphorylase [Candidatus Omnitrophica bacterium]|nr:nicotinate-nucleotide diphosphorylase [Candidatus Omnitrophota bacterium]